MMSGAGSVKLAGQSPLITTGTGSKRTSNHNISTKRHITTYCPLIRRHQSQPIIKHKGGGEHNLPPGAPHNHITPNPAAIETGKQNRLCESMEQTEMPSKSPQHHSKPKKPTHPVRGIENPMRRRPEIPRGYSREGHVKGIKKPPRLTHRRGLKSCKNYSTVLLLDQFKNNEHDWA